MGERRLGLVLWPLLGAMAGVLIGGALGNLSLFGNLVGLAAALLALGLVVTFSAWAWLRLWPALAERFERAGPRETPRAMPAAATPHAVGLQAGLTLPALADGAAVWGVAEALEAIVVATKPGSPTTGGRARLLLAGRVLADGALDERGVARFAVVIDAPGEVALVAEVHVAGEHAESTRRLRIVRYEAEMQARYLDLRRRVQDAIGAKDAFTARELADALAARSAAARGPLLEATRLYELVAYGERAADREAYLALERAISQLERELARQGAFVPA